MPTKTQTTFHARRWRFFVDTCWASLTTGVLIYVLTLLLGYPYGWAALLLFFRAGFWSLGDLDRYRIEILPRSITGPGILLTSERRTVRNANIDSSRTGIRSGRFFVEDSDGTTVTSRLAWYDRDSKNAIVAYLRAANPRLYLDVRELILHPWPSKPADNNSINASRR